MIDQHSRIQTIRDRFPALQLQVEGRPAAFLDGPAGSQVPSVVIEAMAEYLCSANANLDGAFLTSARSDALMTEAGQALADFLNAPQPEEIVFGANMTSLTMTLSRQLSRCWQAGDEIIVTELDHDANITPWTIAAEDAGVRVHQLALQPDDCSLDLEEFEKLLNEKTRLVAFGAASNLVGSINPIRRMVDLAHAHGAQVFVDAVHYAPHRAIDVQAWGCDYLACSAYKFFGPHVGILWGRAELLEQLPSPKLRPVKDRLPDRWMHGTQNHEGIAGTLAAVNYLADLGREIGGDEGNRRLALQAAYGFIEEYENRLCAHLLEGLAKIPGMRIWGIDTSSRIQERTPTVACTHEKLSPGAMAKALGARGVFTWEGNNYALALSEALGLEPEGVLRIGLLHYNTSEEVERLLASLTALVSAG